MTENPFNLPLYKPALFLLIFICAIYSNTLHSGWYLDDYQNITHNPKVHLSHFSKNAIKDSLYAAPSRQDLHRPLSYFSFALNWYCGRDDVFGYRVINIIIHILTSFFLYLTILLLFQSPNLRGWDAKNIYFFALLSTVLWAAHPIQIQAVTYIVQRMASMAALFYIIGIFCYLKARLTTSTAYRFFFLGLCGAAYLLGIASKNNAIILPLILLLMEFIFFRDLSKKKIQKLAFAILFGATIVVAVTGLLLFVDGNMGGIFNAYESRPFTLHQRLLTQPRVLLFYLSQIFYPIVDRFSITHDFTISTSFFIPWTTLPAIVLIFLIGAFALSRIKKNPVFSFSILFFFVNHLVESSIIPLEMVFEHRNYLPTLFLFVPVSIGIKKAFDYYMLTNKPMFFFLTFSLCAVIVGIGTSTYIRNGDWESHKSLWESAMRNAPESGRPLHNLAWGYYEPRGQIDSAINLYNRALHLKFDKSEYRADPYSNLASIYYLRFKDYEKAIENASRAIAIFPDHNKANLLLCHALGKLGHYDEALSQIDKLLLKYPGHVEFLYLKGIMHLRISEPENALKSFRKCLQRSPDNWKYLREIGFSLTKMGYNERGFTFLKLAVAKNPDQAGILLSLAENRISAGQQEEAYFYVNKTIELVGIENIETILISHAKDNIGLPFFYTGIVPLIIQNIQERTSNNIEMTEGLTQYFLL